jgi:hypothetical protein
LNPNASSYFTSNRLGIGTTSPSGYLNVYSGSLNTIPAIKVEGATAGTPSIIGLDIANASSNNAPQVQFTLEKSVSKAFEISTKSGSASLTSRLTIQTDTGNIGLSTTTPVNLLDVKGAVAIGSTYAGTNLAPPNGLLVQGNVGIGTTTTTNKLTVWGDKIAAYDSVSGINNANLYADSYGVYLRANGTTFTSSLVLRTENNSPVTIAAHNNNIILSPGPYDNLNGYKFSTTGILTYGNDSTSLKSINLHNASYTFTNNNTGSNTGRVQNYLYYNTTPQEYLRADASSSGVVTVALFGNVGIGTTVPVNKLDVAGNISASNITASLFFGIAVLIPILVPL